MRCGDHAGYVRHIRAGEDACPACRAGHAAYMREYRRVRRLLGLAVS